MWRASRQSRTAKQRPAAWTVEALEDRALPSHFGPWGTPVNLGPVVNSPAGELRPGISKDGLSLYFSSNRPGGFGDEDLWVSQRASADDPWGQPVNLGSLINSDGLESAPSFSRDGHWLLYHSTGLGGFGDGDIWASYRTDVHDDFGWQPPVNLGPGVNSPYGDFGPTLFEDEETGVTTLYFNSTRPDGPGGFDIYASTRNADGTFGPAVLVPELSTPARDTRLALRHDGREIIIASDRPGGFGGIDLWVSTRPTTLDPWGTPVNLGSTVNTPFTDGAAALSSDGTTLYFYSNRPGSAGNDLWVTTRDKVNGDGQCDLSSWLATVQPHKKSHPGHFDVG
jgi:Tol biopolymer transport system component